MLINKQKGRPHNMENINIKKLNNKQLSILLHALDDYYFNIMEHSDKFTNEEKRDINNLIEKIIVKRNRGVI